jgi:hypothetical protein
MRIVLSAPVLALLSLLPNLWACGPSARDPGTGDDDDTPDAAVQPPPPPPGDAGPGCQAIDVLFVIDNSGSMEEEQSNLAANFPQFVSVLEASGLDYRVAVTTTGRDYAWTMQAPIGGGLPMSQDNGDNGELLEKCGMTKRWIEKTDADVAGTFTCLASVGTDGPGIEMPLGALRDAFEDRIADGTNVGFHRPDALLAVVMLTDEEDCSHEQSVSVGFGEDLCSGGSSEGVASYIQFLDGFTGNHTRWATAVIAGMGPGSCSSNFGEAQEATRLRDFVQQVGPNATMSSICDGDLSTGLAQALALFESACGTIIL